jgi:hypothetical protein
MKCPGRHGTLVYSGVIGAFKRIRSTKGNDAALRRRV